MVDNDLSKESREIAKKQLSLLFDYNVYGVSNDAIRTAIKALDEVGNLKGKVHRLEKYDEDRDASLHLRLIKDTQKETVAKVLSDLKEILLQGYYTKNDDFHGDLQVFSEEDINIEVSRYAEKWGIEIK
jgi:hypothetical protein